MNTEKIVEKILLIFALSATLVIFLIILFLFKEGLPILKKEGLGFILGKVWNPGKEIYGALTFIVGSLSVTFLALFIAVPLGVSCALFLAEIAPKRAESLFRPVIELLAGIPSVVYGMFGLIVIVRFIKVSFDVPTGETVLAGGIVLAIMILPIIISISEDAIKSVPRIYKEGSFALGATHWQTMRRVILPTASSGITASIILAMGRAIGETMAVVLILGNVEMIPKSILNPAEALTSVILLEMGEASVGSSHYQALFAIGIILFIIVMILNIISVKIGVRKK
ncbi:MAG: phosphate ABC transporter permease subunit PstC [Methanomicrobia archaeon]|jgi:phosphate transport system permease protein|nr:phosphate ABC transporter permease subunit PstC [Methanomicrobia archaeon]MCK4637361.1 phosphate ABC transporter permease subunit PstC [Methanomicrobia archaeon]